MSDYKPHPGGRPKKRWKKEEIEAFKQMCSMMCTEKEICALMGVSDKTLVRLINRHLYRELTGVKYEEGVQPLTFNDAFEVYSAQGKASLRRMQFAAAKSGDRTMLVWLGKQWLGQTDRNEINVTEVPQIIDDIG